MFYVTMYMFATLKRILIIIIIIIVIIIESDYTGAKFYDQMPFI